MKDVFTETKDNQGNTYLNGFFNNGGEAIFCFNGTNLGFKGVPKLVLRKGGNSKYGNQFIVQFYIKEKIENYETNSKHNVMEFYFNEKEGIEFLENFLKFLKQK